MEKHSWNGHASMLGANTMWGLMSPISKLVMASSVITPCVVTELRVGGAMLLFWRPGRRPHLWQRLPRHPRQHRSSF